MDDQRNKSGNKSVTRLMTHALQTIDIDNIISIVTVTSKSGFVYSFIKFLKVERARHGCGKTSRNAAGA